MPEQVRVVKNEHFSDREEIYQTIQGTDRHQDGQGQCDGTEQTKAARWELREDRWQGTNRGSLGEELKKRKSSRVCQQKAQPWGITTPKSRDRWQNSLHIQSRNFDPVKRRAVGGRSETFLTWSDNKRSLLYLPLKDAAYSFGYQVIGMSTFRITDAQAIKLLLFLAVNMEGMWTVLIFAKTSFLYRTKAELGLQWTDFGSILAQTSMGLLIIKHGPSCSWQRHYH